MTPRRPRRAAIGNDTLEERVDARLAALGVPPAKREAKIRSVWVWGLLGAICLALVAGVGLAGLVAHLAGREVSVPILVAATVTPAFVGIYAMGKADPEGLHNTVDEIRRGRSATKGES